MPQAVAMYVFTSLFVAGVSGVLLSAAVLGAYALTAIAISYALSAVSQALMGRPRGLGTSQFRDMVVKAPTAARAIIYGEVTCGGVLVWQHTTGNKNEFLDFIIVLAGHQVSSITDVWFDDVKIVNADIGGGAAGGGAVAGSGDFRARDGDTVAYVYKYLGTSGQTASPQMTATDGTGYTMWTAAHRLRGCAYVHIRLRRNSKAYGQGAPSGFKLRVKGALVYDPRLDSTNGGAGAHRLADATTWAWSDNPALCAADYIAGGTIINDVATPVRKRGFAVATPATDIDWSAVITAANICEESVSIPGPSTQDRYQCDCVVVPSDDSPHFDCMDQILTSMLGQLTYTSGSYILYAGAYQAPVYTLTTADLAGTITHVGGKGRAERFNYVRGVRFDLELGQKAEFLPRTDTSYVTADGATLYRDIELVATQNEYRAQRIAQIILRRSREQKTIVWPGHLSAAKIAVWETVYVTVAELGISAKVYRCIARKQRPGGDSDEPVIELTLREEYSTTYADPLTADYGTISVATDPGPVTVQLDTPTNLVAVAITNGIQFTITPYAGADSPGTVYDLYEYSASTPFASATIVWSGLATIVILPKTDTTLRYYWVQARRNTYLSGTFPATTGLAASAASSSTALSVSADYSSLTASGSGATVTSGTVTAAASGGTAGYTYAWTYSSGSASVSITSAAAAATTFSGATMASGESRTATFRCRATDAVAATADVYVTITVSRVSFSVSVSDASPSKIGLTSTLTTPSTTATAVGGTAPYSYAWTKNSGGSITAVSPAAAATTFTATSLAARESRTASFRVTATDSTGGTPLTATYDVNVSIDREDYS